MFNFGLSYRDCPLEYLTIDALLESLVNGEVLEPHEVERMVKTQLKRKVPQLIDALNGRIRFHHRKMIQKHLKHLEYLEKEKSLEYWVQRIKTLGYNVVQLQPEIT
ncbi:hypothetical protein [Brevibacillus sp. SIMBA_040]|uniref:hypothetical protein n=1 Tax=unclassified Brevibacillus TaxID=2684853 RepID=UPI00397CDE9A